MSRVPIPAGRASVTAVAVPWALTALGIFLLQLNGDARGLRCPASRRGGPGAVARGGHHDRGRHGPARAAWTLDPARGRSGLGGGGEMTRVAFAVTFNERPVATFIVTTSRTEGTPQ